MIVGTNFIDELFEIYESTRSDECFIKIRDNMMIRFPSLREELSKNGLGTEDIISHFSLLTAKSLQGYSRKYDLYSPNPFLRYISCIFVNELNKIKKKNQSLLYFEYISFDTKKNHYDFEEIDLKDSLFFNLSDKEKCFCSLRLQGLSVRESRSGSGMTEWSCRKTINKLKKKFDNVRLL